MQGGGGGGGSSGAEGEAAEQPGPPTEVKRKGAGGDPPPTGGMQPDIVKLEGWPETADPPKGPVTHWESPTGVRRAVCVRVGELACTSDLQTEKAVGRKKAKYKQATDPGPTEGGVECEGDSARGHSGG
eukprot:1195057-Prorocentrum_minimum.AAC.3